MTYMPNAQAAALLAEQGITCASQAEHDAAVAACAKVQVKGLGELPIDPCFLSTLPVCPSGFTRATLTAATPGPTSTPTPDSGASGYVVGGLLVLVLAGGAWAIYRGVKKR